MLMLLILWFFFQVQIKKSNLLFFTFKQNFASLKSLSFDFLQNWIEWIRRISEFDEPDVAGLFLQNDPLKDDTIERA